MTGAVSRSVRTLVRLEGLTVLCVAVLLYARSDFGWGLFAVCFLIPDLSFIGYVAGPRVGSVVYNAAHSYVGVGAAVVVALVSPGVIPLAVGLIWAAHIGLDRLVGYGLKYPEGFGFTHLGTIGRRRDVEANDRGRL